MVGWRNLVDSGDLKSPAHMGVRVRIPLRLPYIFSKQQKGKTTKEYNEKNINIG